MMVGTKTKAKQRLVSKPQSRFGDHLFGREPLAAESPSSIDPWKCSVAIPPFFHCHVPKK
jgi:hypothetical protein